ncbi:MAG: stage V sporulation protein T [Lachnospiraceae bacterium]|nr:stage V sporulation protein T [Lachnospiraceae bacterium]
MKATGIVRRIDDLGRIVIPKEIRRTLRIRESAPSLITLSLLDEFGFAMAEVADRVKGT